MPWCEQCSKFWNPSSMTPEGACPTCGRVLPGAAVADRAVESVGGPTVSASSDAVPYHDPKHLDIRALAGEDAKAPWHFKLLVAAVTLYLLWRVVQLVVWVVT